MNPNLNYKKNAKYGFTLGGCLNKNTNLEPNEEIIFKTKIKFIKTYNRIGYFAITDRRIFIIKHYFFRPDIIESIEFSNIKNFSLDNVKYGSCNYLVIHLNYLNEEIYFLCFIFSSNRYKRFYSDDKKTKNLYKKILEIIKKQK